MRHATHENFLRMLYPYANMEIARQINKEVDNPKGFSFYPKSMHTPFDIPGLKKYSHRRKHDALTMAAIAAKYGYDGYVAMAAHAAGDIIRDTMVKQYGRRNADLYEALFNWTYEGFQETKKRARKYRSFNAPTL